MCYSYYIHTDIKASIMLRETAEGLREALEQWGTASKSGTSMTNMGFYVVLQTTASKESSALTVIHEYMEKLAIVDYEIKITYLQKSVLLIITHPRDA